VILEEGKGLSLRSVTTKVYQPASQTRMLGEMLDQRRRRLSSSRSSTTPASLSSVEVPAGGTLVLKATFHVRTTFNRDESSIC